MVDWLAGQLFKVSGEFFCLYHSLRRSVYKNSSAFFKKRLVNIFSPLKLNAYIRQAEILNDNANVFFDERQFGFG